MAQRKAKIPTFWDVMLRGSYAEMEAHWQEGVNSLSESAEFHKCALVANQAWAACAQSMGTGDAAAGAIGKYWWEYLTKRYRGRGIPVQLDTQLVLRYRQATPADVQQSAAQQEEMKLLRDELAEMRASVGKTVAEAVGMALRGANRGGLGGGGLGGGGETRCWVCGETGHRKPNCPQFLASKEGKKAAAAAKKAEEEADK